jgi:hypothetical protein
MYSVGFLGCIMIAESLGQHIASWVPPLVTFATVLAFFLLSRKRPPAAIEKIAEEIVPLVK